MYCMAIIADSFMTSPKFPVNVSFSPLLLLRLDSTNNISPPTAVHAKPVTTPAYSFPSYLSREYSFIPKYSCKSFTVIVCRVFFFQCFFPGDFPHNFGNFLIQFPNTRFPSIRVYYDLHRLFRNVYITFTSP